MPWWKWSWMFRTGSLGIVSISARSNFWDKCKVSPWTPWSPFSCYFSDHSSPFSNKKASNCISPVAAKPTTPTSTPTKWQNYSTNVRSMAMKDVTAKNVTASAATVRVQNWTKRRRETQSSKSIPWRNWSSSCKNAREQAIGRYLSCRKKTWCWRPC